MKIILQNQNKLKNKRKKELDLQINMDQFYFAYENKLAQSTIEKFIDNSVIQQQVSKQQNGSDNNQRAFSKSVSINHYHHHALRYIGPYQIISSIEHVVCLPTKKVQFTDYFCIKQKSIMKGLKRTELSLQFLEQETIKEKLYLLCKSVPKGKQQSPIDFYSLKMLFQKILLSDNNLKAFVNLIFPSTSYELQSKQTENKQYYLPFSINNVLLLIGNIKLLIPLRNLVFSQKFQSQLFCLNLFYRFLLTILKPLLRIIDIIYEKQVQLEQTIVRFLQDCLVMENVFYQERTNQFFLFFNCQRYRKHQENEKNQQKTTYKIDSIQKRILSKVSIIFWALNSSLSAQKHHNKHFSYLHNSFMSNFLFSIKNGQLNFQQTLEILQSKQKRKAFIGFKLQEIKLKQANNYELYTGGGKNRKLCYPVRVSETVDVNNHQVVNIQEVFQNSEKPLVNNITVKNQKSMRRKLNQKRNTIDVMLQNFCFNKNVPPSFLNRSLEKKGRLFRHDNSVNKSRSRDRSYQSYFDSSTRKGTLQHNCSLNYSSSKKKNVYNYQSQLKNSRYELSCRKNLFPSKSPNRQVSRTIDISNINELKQRIRQKPIIKRINQAIGFQSQSRLQKMKSFSFVRTNPQSSKLELKVNEKQHGGSVVIQDQMQNRIALLQSKENIFIRTDNMNKLREHSKKVNRRYYYNLNNNNIIGNNNNESIRRLIEQQMEIHRVMGIGRSKQKQLLNKSQQKALANFNRQFGRRSNNNQNQMDKQIHNSSKQRKIDDNLFKAKFASCFTEDVNAIYKNTIDEQELDGKSTGNNTYSNQIANISNKLLSRVSLQQECCMTLKVSWQQQNKLQNQNLQFIQSKKIQNQYFVNVNSKHQIGVDNNTGQKQISKMNLNNVEGIFVERVNERNIQINEELEIPQRVSFYDQESQISDIEITEKDQQIQNIVSTINPMKMGNSSVTVMQIDKGIGQEIRNDTLIEQNTILKSSQQQKVIQQSQLHLQNYLKPSFHQIIKQEINQKGIQQVKVVQREPIVQKSKKQSMQMQEKKKNEKNFPLGQSKGSKQQIKLVKKEQKKPSKIAINDEDNDLEEIKLTPVAKMTKTDKNVSQKSQKQSTKSEPQEFQQINLKQPPLPPKQSQQSYQPSQSQQLQGNGGSRLLTSKHSAKSSQASSYGPHKTVRKIVQQYIFFINRIGEAVAKSALVSKKIQKVCEWYVGVYFLYKRFFYQRKKIEKYLKEGIPKLTRYDEDINQDEWEVYLKSVEREDLLKKVTEENAKITQSIQKMQGKLMGRKVSEQIKKFSVISSRSSRQSLIAIEAVIDQFDLLSENGMLKDQQILVHCSGLLNACLVLAELDKLNEDIVPIAELVKLKRTPEELEVIAQDVFDLYHEEEGSVQGEKKN